jgi:hypothetical protein
MFFSRDFGSDRLQHCGLPAAVAVEDDDVSKSVLGQAFEDLFDERAIRALCNSETRRDTLPSNLLFRTAVSERSSRSFDVRSSGPSPSARCCPHRCL